MIIQGDALETLRSMPPNSIDSVVTDPPYGIRFMSKHWDYDVPTVELWRECLRVLKPGGHMLVACGTRTQHRMAVNIEDAGFEIRDTVAWIYGSGFPKSLDISKALDKAAGAEREVVGQYSSPEGTTGESKGGLFNGGGLTAITAPSTDLAKQWQGWGTALKPALEIWTLAKKPSVKIDNFWYEAHNLCLLILNALPAELLSQLSLSENGPPNTVQWNVESSINTLDDLLGQMDTLPLESDPCFSLSTALLWRDTLREILKHASTFTTEMETSLTTDLKTLSYLLLKSTRWNMRLSEIRASGEWSLVCGVESLLISAQTKLFCIQITDATRDAALSPNMDLITLARKPIEGTVAQNVTKHGVGGLNIDGCRVELQPGETTSGSGANQGGTIYSGEGSGFNAVRVGVPNIKSTVGRFPANILFDEEAAEGHEWSRFFYVAKASKSERNAGLEGMPEKITGQRIKAQSAGRKDAGQQESSFPQANHHPTVKPLKLMRYLCRMITPPEGIVLDPFMGSGSTGVAATEEGFRFQGIERETEYCEIARRRIDHANEQRTKRPIPEDR